MSTSYTFNYKTDEKNNFILSKDRVSLKVAEDLPVLVNNEPDIQRVGLLVAMRQSG